MDDHPHHIFHLARAEAERAAAIRASSDMTRALHIEMAALHADRAWSVVGEGHVGRHVDGADYAPPS